MKLLLAIILICPLFAIAGAKKNSKKNDRGVAQSAPVPGQNNTVDVKNFLMKELHKEGSEIRKVVSTAIYNHCEVDAQYCGYAKYDEQKGELIYSIKFSPSSVKVVRIGLTDGEDADCVKTGTDNEDCSRLSEEYVGMVEYNTHSKWYKATDTILYRFRREYDFNAKIPAWKTHSFGQFISSNP